MTTAITAFDFENTPVRAFERGDGSIWFIAADVCRALDIKNTSQSVASLDDDEKGICSTYTLGGDQGVLMISEGGLYTLILRSRQATTPGTLPHRFRRWVTGEVLPAIRRAGRYEAAPAAAPGLPARDWPPHELHAKTRAVEVYRHTHGLRAARWLSAELGLPQPPADLLAPLDAPPPPPAPFGDHLSQLQRRDDRGRVYWPGANRWIENPDAEGWVWDHAAGRWTLPAEPRS